MSLVEGQELWLVFRERRRGEPRTVKVEKVGRKWAQINYSGYRIDIETLRVDGAGYTSPAQCWLRREDWEAEVRRQEVWDKLRGYFDRKWNAPSGITTDKLEEILAALPRT